MASQEFENVIQRIEWHLDRYGNTSNTTNPKKYLKRLNKDGYLVDVRYVPPKGVPTGRGMDEIYIETEMWVISLIKKERK